MPVNKDNVVPSGYQTRLDVYSQWSEPRQFFVLSRTEVSSTDEVDQYHRDQ
jgi:hypothetical protein